MMNMLISFKENVWIKVPFSDPSVIDTAHMGMAKDANLKKDNEKLMKYDGHAYFL